MFGSAREDEALERLNQVFWRSLLQHIRDEVEPAQVRTVLDVGCHHGGLLELLAQALHPQQIWGLEPLERARQRALFRLQGRAPQVRVLTPAQWPSLPTHEVDVLTCHEVLHLVRDVTPFMEQVARVLRPGGTAYLVLGSHAENPLWGKWKPQLEEEGHRVFDHAPLDILAAGSLAGLRTAVRPLRRQGWVLYDPVEAEYRYDSMREMFDHHYRHKLLFRLVQPDA